MNDQISDLKASFSTYEAVKLQKTIDDQKIRHDNEIVRMMEHIKTLKNQNEQLTQHTLNLQ